MANMIDNMSRAGVAWFKMDEASGNILDSKGSFVGTPTGTTVVAGYSGGNARSFNGTSDYISFNNTVIPLGKKSIRFKINMLSMPTETKYFLNNCLDLTSTHKGYLFFLDNTTGGVGVCFWNGTTTTINIKSASSIIDGQWHDVLLTIDNTYNCKLYIDDMNIPKATGVQSSEVQATENLLIGKSNNSSRFFNGEIDELEIYNDVISGIPDKILVNHNGTYKYYTTSWQTIGTTVTDSDYKTYGMNDVSTIPQSAWQELIGTVELDYWTDATNKTEIQFNVTTNPFTLADEFEGQDISVIQYSDDPNATSVTTTIETDPFTFYDEMGDSIDILYYTDDSTKTSAQLDITANYTPLDEINEDFDVVTWTNGVPEEQSDTINSTISSDVIDSGSLYVSNEIDLTKGMGIKKIQSV